MEGKEKVKHIGMKREIIREGNRGKYCIGDKLFFKIPHVGDTESFNVLVDSSVRLESKYTLPLMYIL